jgi:multiple sugar transport system ATP-binding protein
VDGGVLLSDHTLPIEREVLAKATGDTVMIGIRPEAFDVSDTGQGIPLNVSSVEETGADAFLYGQLADARAEASIDDQQIVARVKSRAATAGSQVRLSVTNGKVHVFDKVTELRLN